MRFFVVISFVFLSCLFGQGEEAGEANVAFDEVSEKNTKPREHMQAIDGVAAVVGDRIVLKSDINQTLAMAIFQQRLNPQKDISKIEKLKKEITKSIINRKVVLAMAELDSVEVSDKEVDRALDQQVENIVAQAGSEEAAEKALGQPLRTFRREYWYEIKDMLITQISTNLSWKRFFKQKRC